MLFNSYVFIFGFLPLTWLVHQDLRRRRLDRAATAFLALASLAFYAWWSVQALGLLVVLMFANYWATRRLMNLKNRATTLRRIVLTIGVTGNLAVLAYFKYANFFLENWAALTGSEVDFLAVALPLGMSFFTFQKIALLVDAYQGKVDHLDPLGFVLFVSFFPQLIAGPIVHHREVMPQFRRRGPVTQDEIALGLTIFVMGLFKKVLLADNLALFATPVFDAAAAGRVPGFLEAWAAALAYTLQLYFDFSGYSDMAIGAALLFGIRLPVNFASPYKADSIIEFWRRWHITLSRFLRTYLYVPLGGNRHGSIRRYLNLFITMLLGGLWHGAGWTFVTWGALQAFYLVVNHGWRALRIRLGWTGSSTAVTRVLAFVITFLAVVIGWVFFRAAHMNAAVAMLQAMAACGDSPAAIIDLTRAAVVITPLLALVWAAPSSLELVHYSPDSAVPVAPPAPRFTWFPTPGWALACGLVLAVCLISLTRVSEFLYFQF